MNFPQPKIQFISYKIAKVLEAYSYTTVDGKTITAEKDFEFDGNSTFIDKFKPTRLPASLIHDKLYKTGKFNDGTECTQIEADQIYYTILSKCKTWRITRVVFYAGLRLFGWKAWNNYRKVSAVVL